MATSTVVLPPFTVSLFTSTSTTCVARSQHGTPVRVSEAAQGTDENATHVSTSIIAPSGSGDGVSFSLSRVSQSLFTSTLGHPHADEAAASQNQEHFTQIVGRSAELALRVLQRTQNLVLGAARTGCHDLLVLLVKLSRKFSETLFIHSLQKSVNMVVVTVTACTGIGFLV